MEYKIIQFPLARYFIPGFGCTDLKVVSLELALFCLVIGKTLPVAILPDNLSATGFVVFRNLVD